MAYLKQIQALYCAHHVIVIKVLLYGTAFHVMEGDYFTVQITDTNVQALGEIPANP